MENRILQKKTELKSLFAGTVPKKLAILPHRIAILILFRIKKKTSKKKKYFNFFITLQLIKLTT